MADDHDALAIEAGQATDDGRVVGKGTVAMQLVEVGHQRLDVVQRVGALRMARHQGRLPRGELFVEILQLAVALGAQPVDFFGNVHGRVALHEAQLLDLALEFGDRCSKSR